MFALDISVKESESFKAGVLRKKLLINPTRTKHYDINGNFKIETSWWNWKGSSEGLMEESQFSKHVFLQCILESWESFGFL